MVKVKVKVNSHGCRCMITDVSKHGSEWIPCERCCIIERKIDSLREKRDYPREEVVKKLRLENFSKGEVKE